MVSHAFLLQEKLSVIVSYDQKSVLKLRTQADAGDTGEEEEQRVHSKSQRERVEGRGGR
jgi:hypothetical protein